MTDSEPAAPPQPSSPRPRRFRRRWLIVVAIVTGVLGLLAGLVLEAPRYIARYVTNTYLKGVDVDVEGVKTLDIDLPNGELTFGPVRFRDIASTTETAPAGQVGRLTVRIGLRNLLQKHALIEEAVIEGVEITIAQAADGEISVNGIPLRRLLAEKSEKTEAPQPEKSEKPGWGTGVDAFSLRDIRLTFEDASGGKLTLNIERLDLTGFRSWEPDSPGTFTLLANINGIPLIAWGQMEPFAETLRGRIELSAQEIELPKIETFTGPLDLDSRLGVGTVDMRGRFSLTPDSRIDAFAIARIGLSGVDVAGADGGMSSANGSAALTAEVRRDGNGNTEATASGSVDLHDTNLSGADGATVAIGDTDLTLDAVTLRAAADSSAEITAQPRLVLSEGKVAAGDGPGAAFDETRLAIGDLKVKRQSDGRIAISGHPQLDIVKPVLSGSAEANAAAISLAVPTLSLETGSDGTRVTGDADLSLDAVSARFGGADAQASTVAVSSTSLGLRELTLTQGTDGTQLKGGAEVTLKDVSMRTPGAAADAGDVAIASVSLALEEFAAAITPERMEVSGAPTLTVAKPAFKQGSADVNSGASATDVGAESLEVSAKPLRVVLSGDSVTSELSVTSRIDKPRGLLQSAQRIDAAADALTADLKDATITSGKGSLDITGQIQSELTALAVSLAPGSGSGSADGTDSGTHAAVDSITFNALPLAVKTGESGARLDGDASIQLKQMKLNVAAREGGPIAADIAGLKLGLAKMSGIVGDSATRLQAGIQFSADDARADLALLGKGASASFNTLKLDLSPVSVAGEGETWRVSSPTTLELGRLAGALPDVGGHAVTAQIGALQLSLAEAEATAGKETLAWKTRLDLGLSSLSASLDKDRFASGKIEKINLRNLRANQTLDIEADTLAVTSLRAAVNLPKAPAAAKASAPSPSQEEAAPPRQPAESETPRLRLRQFGILDRAIVRVNDPNVNPPLAVSLDVQKLNLLNVDTARSKERTDIDLDATINDSAQLTLSGWSSALGAKSDFAMTGRIQDLQLPALSGVVAQAVGVNIDSGRLDVDLAAKAAAGELNGVIDLSVADLALGGLDEQQKARLTEQVGLPIETAVDLLKSPDGTINLKLPVAGNLKSPSFDPSEAIGKALTGALQAAALAPFRLAFAPVSLLTGAVEASGLPKLTPIPFAAGAASLDPQADGMVRALASVLKERPALALKVCGRATSADFENLIASEPALAKLPPDQRTATALPRLQRLVDERTRTVRKAVIEAGGLKPARVGECRAIADSADNSAPRVEVTF